MKFTIKSLAENILFALNIFVLFQLAFFDNILVPYWLQPVGRMHPLLLHFPIVLVLLAMLLEFFRFKSSYAKEKIYQEFNATLFLCSALLTTLTVIMGLLLSKEEGYTGDLLKWHKWTGVCVAFMVSAIYWSRNSSWYKAPIAKMGTFLTTLCLIITGHYGASLTHGENFILEPIMPAAETIKIPIDQAVIFDHVVMPIFTQKCVSCHNTDKAKGELVMTDIHSLLKGGKTGKLLVSGRPEVSLLLERIHLPLEEKKHMPPKGKTQLTAEEMAILRLWIKDNTDLEKKVTTLADGDSLKILATSVLAPSDKNTANYHFAAADRSTIEKLNNNYRVIYPLAKGSPALAVNIYNKSIYHVETLKELQAIKKQIVSLNLANLPIKDDHLKIINQFENLRTLNLNFTDITGEALAHLKPLKQLHHLSLSGTQANYSSVKEFLKSSKIKQLTLWNTQLTQTEISELQKANNNIVLIGGFKDDGKSPAKLNPPRLLADTAVFDHTLFLEIKHPINGVQIRYTTDGSEPDSIRSPLYDSKIEVKENTLLKIRAFKDGWFGSDLVSAHFYKSRYRPDRITLLLPTDPLHKGEDGKTLIDRILGDQNTNSDKWLGFRENPMEILLHFKQAIDIQSVTLHILQQLSASILPPTEIEIWGGSDKNNLKLLALNKIEIPKKGDADTLIPIETTFKPQSINHLKIIAKNIKKLPAWHPAKGASAWLFMDELLLN